MDRPRGLHPGIRKGCERMNEEKEKRYALHLNVVTQRFSLLDATPFESPDGDLDAFRRMFPENPPGETILDAAFRTVCGVPVVIFCDDEGLLRKDPILSAAYRDGTPALVGSLLVMSEETDGDGGALGLTEEQVRRICGPYSAGALARADTAEGPRTILVLDTPDARGTPSAGPTEPSVG